MPPNQRRIAVVALVIFAAGMLWLLTHRKSGAALGDTLRAPHVITLKARDLTGAERALDANQPSLSNDEVLDFELEVPDQSYIYVFREQGGTVGLAYGHRLIDEPWDPGVYAPDWYDFRKGMPLKQSGTVTVYAVAAPFPLPESDKWDLDTLENVKSKCSRCGISHIAVTVTEPPKDRPPPLPKP